VAGTGAKARRGASLNMQRQARRFDADGIYRMRHREVG
jgi:hypothetical protein